MSKKIFIQLRDKSGGYHSTSNNVTLSRNDIVQVEYTPFVQSAIASKMLVEIDEETALKSPFLKGFDKTLAEKVEAERLEAERIESERIENERLEAERIETERVEAERLEAEKALELTKVDSEKPAKKDSAKVKAEVE